MITATARIAAIAGLCLAAELGAGSALAEDAITIELVIRNHQFAPAELKVPANKPITITVRNEDDAAEEFESTDLRVEKVIAAKSTGTFRIKPLKPGKYPFVGEYHEATARGTLIAE